MKIEYQVKEIETIMDYYVKGFGKKVFNYEWFYDSQKKQVVLKLYVNEEKTKGKS